MGVLATLAIKLIGDASGMIADFNDAEKAAGGFSDRMKKIGGGMAVVGGAMTATVTGPIMGVFAAGIDAASDLNETISKTETVFGKQADSMKAWGDAASKAMGLSKQQALDAAGTYGALFRSMGMTEDASAGMSKEIVQLSADLASFNNLETTDVLEKMRAGLTGETEPLKSLGVNLNAAMVQAKAFQMGLVKTDVDMTKVNGATIKLNEAIIAQHKAYEKYGEFSIEGAAAAQKVAEAQANVEKAMGGSKVELDAAAKAQATMALILEQTKLAQGDFAKTSDGLANSQRIIKAEIGNVTAAIGAQLLPIVLQVVTYGKQWLDWLTALSPEQQRMAVIIMAVVAAIGPLLIGLGGVISAIGAIVPVVTGVVGVLSGPLLLVIAAVAAAIGILYWAWTNNVGGIQQKAQAALAWIVTAFNEIVAFIGRHGTELTGLFTSIYNTVQGVITTFTVLVSGIFQAFLQLLNGDTQGAMDTLKGTFTVVWGLIQTVFEDAKTAALNALALLLDGSISDARGKLEELKGTFVQKWNDTLTWLGGLPQRFINLAADIMAGLINGIRAQMDAVAQALIEVIEYGIRAFMNKLGMHSPSRVYWGMGRNMMLGLAGGINDNAALASAALANMSTDMATPDTAFGSGRGDAQGGRGITINIGEFVARSRDDIDYFAAELKRRIDES